MAEFKNKTDSPEELFKRFTHARNIMLLQRSRLEDAYDLTLPNRANFRENVPGDQRNVQIFDSTASDGLKQYANDVQSILMPPFQRWSKLVPGTLVPEAQEDAVRENLERVTEIVFHYLDQSNFYQVSAQAFEDMGISTGIMVLEEGSEESPLVFRSVAISEVAFTEGRDSKIANFWRLFKTTLREATLMWPDLQLTDNLQMRLKTDPDGEVEFIEGSVVVPGDRASADEFQHYIQSMDDKNTLLLNEKRDRATWFGFRAAKTTGETIGYGPVLRILPAIRSLNGMAEYDLRSFKFAAIGAYMVDNSGVLNPFNVTVEPGALIPIEPSMSGKDPIRPIQTSGAPQLTLEKIQAMQASIREALISQPLPPQVKAGVSATEISVRQQFWVRQNSAAFGRISVELIEPILSSVVALLSKRKLIPSIIINKTQVAIKYESPLIAIQDQEDVAKVQQNIELVQSTFGEQGVAVAFDQGELNSYISEKLGVPSKLVNSAAKIKQILTSQQQAAQAQAQAQAQPGLPAGQVGQPQLPLASQGQQSPGP